MLRNLYIKNTFFWSLIAIAILFIGGFILSPLFIIAQFILFLFIGIVLYNYWLLFHTDIHVDAQRQLPKVFSLSDPNTVQISFCNTSKHPVDITFIDELPFEFQKRDFEEHFSLNAQEEKLLQYQLRPTQRGLYAFGRLQIFVSLSPFLLERRITIDAQQEVAVYPSIVQMKALELNTFNKMSYTQGIKKIRRIGHSYEFEQIKPYVQGDDYRSINWKASSRNATLMVNQYEDERSQQVYCIIDKSRVMRMPFNGLSLTDYAINSALAISNIILKKHDKAGLITFSDKIGTTLKADSRPNQLNKILLSLYNEKERPVEANYQLLYHIARQLINGRSMILLYTNFESMAALERNLPILRKINKFHLLVVIFFENEEIEKLAQQPANSLKDIYKKTIAQKFSTQKIQIAQTLQQYGIQSIITRPEDLSVHTINKYLELKSRGML